MFTPTSAVAFRKGGILHLGYRKTGRHIAALTLAQMCRLFYLKRVAVMFILFMTFSEPSWFHVGVGDSWNYMRFDFYNKLTNIICVIHDTVQTAPRNDLYPFSHYQTTFDQRRSHEGNRKGRGLGFLYRIPPNKRSRNPSVSGLKTEPSASEFTIARLTVQY